MATFSAACSPSNSTAALFREWAQAIHDAFDNAGWVQTADTGQIDLTTVAAPGAANTSMGYEIWGMDDALQATRPVYVKIEYGSGAATNRPGLWIHIGTDTDGAGTILGRVFNSRKVSSNAYMASAADSTTADQLYSWGNTGAIAMGIFAGGIGPNYVIAFSVERTRDVDGTVTDEGVVFFGSTTSNGTLTRSRVWSFDEDHGLVPPDSSVAYALTAYNSTISDPASGFRDLHTAPVLAARDVLQPWTRTWLVTRSTSLYIHSGSRQFYPLVDATQRTYRTVGGLAINNNSNDTLVYVLMRWNDDTY